MSNTVTDIFNWLVDYHINVNLKLAMPYIIDGSLRDRFGSPLREGSDSNSPTKGVLIVSNGQNLIFFNSLNNGMIAKPTDFAVINSRETFNAYLNHNAHSDGAYIFNGINNVMLRTPEINNNPLSLQKKFSKGFPLSEFLPRDFLHFNSNEEVDEFSIGTKTRLALKAPHAYKGTDTFQIKRSAYNSLGLGKVTHFNEQGLVEEFFLLHDPNSDGPFIDKENKIKGVYRKYDKIKGKVSKVEEFYIGYAEPSLVYA